MMIESLFRFGLCAVLVVGLNSVGANQLNAQPSFNCARASSQVEYLICRDKALAAQDREMMTAYKQLLGELSSEEQRRVIREQRAWLSERDSCPSAKCVRDSYQRRLDDIYGVTSAASKQETTPSLQEGPTQADRTKRLLELLTKAVACPIPPKSGYDGPIPSTTLTSYKFTGNAKRFALSYRQVEDWGAKGGEGYRRTATGGYTTDFKRIGNVVAKGTRLVIQCSGNQTCISQLEVRNPDAMVCPECPHGDTRESRQRAVRGINLDLCSADEADNARFGISGLIGE